jgi:hypothetical protein
VVGELCFTVHYILLRLLAESHYLQYGNFEELQLATPCIVIRGVDVPGTIFKEDSCLMTPRINLAWSRSLKIEFARS